MEYEQNHGRSHGFYLATRDNERCCPLPESHVIHRHFNPWRRFMRWFNGNCPLSVSGYHEQMEDIGCGELVCPCGKRSDYETGHNCI